MLDKISDKMLSYDHYDKSRQVKETTNIIKIDLPRTIKEFDEAKEQRFKFMDISDINNMSDLIEKTLYNACYKHRNIFAKIILKHQETLTHTYTRLDVMR